MPARPGGVGARVGLHPVGDRQPAIPKLESRPSAPDERLVSDTWTIVEGVSVEEQAMRDRLSGPTRGYRETETAIRRQPGRGEMPAEARVESGVRGDEHIAN